MVSSPSNSEATGDGLPEESLSHTPADVEEDLLWYQDFCEKGEWLIDIEREQCFVITDGATEDDPRVSLGAASRLDLSDNAPRFVPISEPHHSRTITDIAAQLESGRLVYIPQQEPLTFSNSTIFRANGVIAHLDSGVAPAPSTVTFGGYQHKVGDFSLATLPKPAIFLPPRASDKDGIDDSLRLSPVSAASERLQDQSRARHYDGEDQTIKTRYLTIGEPTKYTFESQPIRKFVESHIEGRTLNACAGKERLNHSGEIIRNDLRPSMPADLHVDVAALSKEFPSESFETVVYDPDWTLYQANLRYDEATVHKSPDDYPDTRIDVDELPIELDEEKSQIGHSRLAKEGFDHLLKPGGKVIEISYTGSCMPRRLGYERTNRTIFDPLGEGKAIIGSVDRKVQTGLSQFSV